MPRKVEIETLKHDDTRVNIPTSETSGYMTEEQRAEVTQTYERYRRDPALDPQLVWNGKDEEDEAPLSVVLSPIYVQEKIHPKAIVENVRALSAENQPMQLSLFDDFNGIAFEDAVDFYQHEQHWTNRLILGDSLAVMASLAEKESLRGKVQMIYIDPPYGIKFNSNWQPSTMSRKVEDGKDVTYEPEQIQAFRDTWERGIHSYLKYLRDRFRVARELMTESGSIFVQIGDENVHLVRNLLDEVFGPENLISLITVVKTSAQEDLLLPSVCDYVLWYAKSADNVKYRQIWHEKSFDDAGVSEYNRVELSNTTRRKMDPSEQASWEVLPEGARIYRQDNIVSQRPPGSFPVELEGEIYRPITGFWKTGVEGMERLLKARRVEKRGKMLSYVRFFEDFPLRPIANFWSDVRFSSRSEEKIYVVQTAGRIIERCMLMATEPGDLVLDPTCGSGTTAYVAEQWGRRWITFDTSRVALALARTRLMSARFTSYELKTDKVSDGFVYKSVPHITLKSIANNAQIDVIHDRYQPALDDLLAQINALAAKTLQAWELPSPTPLDERNDPDASIHALLDEWWQIKQQRQAEIDKAIRDAAEVETLYDQPIPRAKVVRVTGPFTVESLSPYRALDASARRGKRDSGQFLLDMLEQMQESGVTNTRKGEKIIFDQIDLYPGKYVQAAGVYQRAEGVGRAAILIGPQYGTVSWEMIVKASKEAVNEVLQPFDTLIACGFGFDPDVHSKRGNIGRLVVQTARINPELLLMGKDLKKGGNNFTVFGEPDVEIIPYPAGQIAVKLLGVDIYDPSRHEIRSSSTGEVACWFVDTNYNDQSFFVRHAYFTNPKTYDKLKSALNAEINPEAWEALYRGESLPFDAPESGKIAVKVINHFGDEVMKVCEV